MYRTFCSVILIITFVMLLGTASADDSDRTITLMSHDSFGMDKDILQTFENQNNVKVRILKAGDAGKALTQAILSKNNPMADVFFGVDNTFLGRALKADIFISYASPELANIPDKLKLDKSNRMLPVDFGDVCLNYHKAWFKKHNIAPPHDLDDLIDPKYKNLTVVQNPAISSPGLAFLLTTIGRYGEEGYLSYWKKLRENGVYITKGWTDAYFGQFSKAKGGTRPIVVSYASSPPVEVVFAKEKLDDAPTAAVLAPRSGFRQVEFVGILKGTKKLVLAKKLVDFLLSPTFQKSIPLNFYMFPAVSGIPLPDVFTKYTKIVEDPIMISFEDIDSKREKWIEDWTETVLR